MSNHAPSLLPRLFHVCDQLGTVPSAANAVANGANRVLLVGLLLLALSLPHSIAAIWISLSLCVVGWLVRDLALRHFHWARTPLDWPLLGFAGLTLLSALASAEPAISLPKARSLFIFGVLYLCLANLHARAVNVLLGALLVSSLAGVLFSFGEKLIGRGMVVTAMQSDSPLANTHLQVGDVIWMIDRHRVSSLEDVTRLFAQYDGTQRIEIEALHDGDPLPVAFILTNDLKARANPLGLQVDGRSRRFRVSGFTRHFLTYAEQMQMLGLFAFGMFLHRGEGEKGSGGKEKPKERVAALSPLLPFSPTPLLLLFSLALILTASRAVIACFLVALVLTSLLVASRRLALFTIVAAMIVGGIAGYVLLSTRTSSAINFADDSSARRIGYMKAGLRLIPQHPWLGTGMDAHKKHWHEWGFPGDYITHTHSTPIQLAMERGLPAFGCYVWLMLALGGWLWRGYRQKQNPLALGALAAWLGFSLSSLANYNFGDSEVVMLMLFLAALSTSPFTTIKKA